LDALDQALGLEPFDDAAARPPIFRATPSD
jgi:hypothetical protein